MDFIRLLGAVIAVILSQLGSGSKSNAQRICRRGTELPCYRVCYIQDWRRRLSFADASRACQSDGGELLSIETEGEQRLIERFITELQVGDGDFWIGLRRSLQRFRAQTTSTVCPSQYYWLDGSKAKFRNWHWDEPSCGTEMCVALYHQPSAPPDEEGHYLFQWNDDNCNSKNNYVCKYTEKKALTTSKRNTVAPTSKSKIVSTTDSVDKLHTRLPESSVSLSDNILFFLYATIPALLLLLLLVSTAGFFCYRHHLNRQKTELETGQHQQWTTADSPCPVQGPYALSDVTKLPPTALDCSLTARPSCGPPFTFQFGDHPEQQQLLGYILDDKHPENEIIIKDCNTCLTRGNFQTLGLRKDMDSEMGNACLRLVQEILQIQGKSIHVVDLYIPPTWLPTSNCNPAEGLPVNSQNMDAIVIPLWVPGHFMLCVS
uniref:C-type lectin domain-containing protein n=1 Tax=Knipowitschia caucasica TaxID=637954 RepID=A0AAV2J508_KNICA